MVLTVSFALSPVIGLVCHRHLADTSAKLDAGVEASGPHDFAVRLQRRSSSALSASTASRPTSVTIASAPHEERDGGSYEVDLGQGESGKFLRGGLDRKIARQPVGQITRPRSSSYGGQVRLLSPDKSPLAGNLKQKSRRRASAIVFVGDEQRFTPFGGVVMICSQARAHRDQLSVLERSSVFARESR